MISVITPLHHAGNPFIRETYAGMLSQTLTEWEWLIGPNAGGVVPDEIAADPRVRVIVLQDDEGKDGVEYNQIGRLKGELSACTRGEYVLELDADDILLPTALEKTVAAFEADPKVALVYSNDAEFRVQEDDSWFSDHYSDYWGWRWRPFEYQGHTLQEMIAWEPSPHMLRFIYWAPNHLRAWRASSYRIIGGHDRTLRCGDDHDLLCRMFIAYGARGFKHLGECLYLYRVHDLNSVKVYASEVQEQTLRCYLKYSREMATRWARDEELLCLDLGGRLNAWPSYTTVDLWDADVLADLNERWPFKDSSVGVIRASHVFEHLKDPIHTMNEAYRVLAPGGWLFVDVPSTDGRGAFQDPTHVSFWNENSFWYYTNQRYASFIQPSYNGRFQVSRLGTIFPGDFEREHDIPWAQADLIALKKPYDERPVGEALI